MLISVHVPWRILLFQPGCSLIQTKEMEMSPDDALRVFGMDAYNSAVIQGEY